MQDSIIKGTGNSRYLKSIAAFLTQYPTYADFASALAMGTLPVELNGINEEGFQQLGTALNKENLLKDTTAALYGLGTDAVPDDVLKKILRVGWELIAEYKTAGSFTFTVPDGVTEIGVYMVGGGGAGGYLHLSSSSSTGATATGGASGYAKNVIMAVEPGEQKQIVVGEGGIHGSATKNGGSTSFGGITVDGGNGGNSGNTNNYAAGADGGQGSDGCVSYPSTDRKLYGGTNTIQGYNDDAKPGTSQPARESQNAFDPTMVTLSAGGWAYRLSNNSFQTISPMPDGTKGGDGAAGYGTDAQGEHATGNGNGGGAACAKDTSSTVCTATAGSGSPGMVLIYKRGIVE